MNAAQCRIGDAAAVTAIATATAAAVRQVTLLTIIIAEGGFPSATSLLDTSMDHTQE